MRFRDKVTKRIYGNKVVNIWYKNAQIEKSNNRKTLQNEPVLLDTSLKTDNAGDDIIMHFSGKQINEIWPNYNFERFPTHGRQVDMDISYRNRPKILCGTNALTTMMEIDCPVAFPKNSEVYRDSVVLMAVGVRYVHDQVSFSEKTAAFLRYVLSSSLLHSVRDENTARCLKEIGISNVINTSCVTMWGLTPERCDAIPSSKASKVLTTITDYDRDSVNDAFMLETLSHHYDEVNIWIQGIEDEQYLQNICDVSKYKLISGGFAGLQRFVDTHGSDMDYFGTRLHCGIYCINHGIRSMIVSIDNRAEDIHKDTGLPILSRKQLHDKMDEVIEGNWKTRISIPEESISLWKQQFRSAVG